MNFDHFGAKAAVPNLVLALSHPDPVVREYAALEFDSVLWDQKDPQVEVALTKAAQDPEERVRVAAKKALRRIRGTP